MIPFIAQILSRVMADIFGIYKVRMSRYVDSGKVDEEIVQSIQFYEQCGIFSTDYFFGNEVMGKKCTAQNFTKVFKKLTCLAAQKPQKSPTTVEIMCHVAISGIPPCCVPSFPHSTFSSPLASNLAAPAQG